MRFGEFLPGKDKNVTVVYHKTKNTDDSGLPEKQIDLDFERTLKNSLFFSLVVLMKWKRCAEPFLWRRRERRPSLGLAHPPLT
jgi:hypothetical protein